MINELTPLTKPHMRELTEAGFTFDVGHLGVVDDDGQNDTVPHYFLYVHPPGKGHSKDSLFLHGKGEDSAAVFERLGYYARGFFHGNRQWDPFKPNEKG